MHIMQFIKRAPSYLDRGIALHLIGSSGIGKSDGVRALKKKMEARDKHEWGISTNLLGMQTPPDLNGVLMAVHRDVKDDKGKMRSQLMSEFSVPPWMISDCGRPMNSFKRGIVFFDERDKADPDTVKAVAEPLLHGRAGRHQLHKGISCISCSNERKHRSGSSKEYDFIINREQRWTLRPHVPSWVVWAIENGIDPLFVTYAEKHPHIVFADEHPAVQGPWCTPRSYVRFCEILKADFMKDGRIEVEGSRAELMEEGEGMIGLPAIEDFLTWIRAETEVPSIDEIIRNPSGARVPERPDGQLLVVYMAAAAFDKKNAEKLTDYILRTGEGFHTTFAAAVLRRDRTMAAVPAFSRRLAAKNASIINMISSL